MENNLVVSNQENTVSQGHVLKITLMNLKNQFDVVREYISSVFVAGVDFGAIPNKDESKLKNTLLLPGAEKIVVLLKLQVYYELIEKILDFDRNYIDYEYKCVITTNDGSFAVEAFASCNSREKGFPQSKEAYKVDAFQFKDNISKKARKRAFIDAVQKISGIRDYFNQSQFPVISLDKETEKRKEEQARKELENKLGYAVSQIKNATAKNFGAVKNKYSDLKEFVEFKQAIEQKALELAPKKANVKDKEVVAVPEEVLKIEPEILASKRELPEVIESKITDEQLTKEALEEISKASTVEILKAIKQKYNGLSKRSPIYKKALETKISLILSNLLDELKEDANNCFDNSTLKLIENNSKYEPLRKNPEFSELYLEVLEEVKERLTPPTPKKEIKTEPVQAELISENDLIPKWEDIPLTVKEIKPENNESQIELVKKELSPYDLTDKQAREFLLDVEAFHEKHQNSNSEIKYNYAQNLNICINRVDAYTMQLAVIHKLEALSEFEHNHPSYIDFQYLRDRVKNKREYLTSIYRADKLISTFKK